MAYIHKRCGYDVVKVQGEENGIDVLTLLEGATEFPQMEDPYYPLREFFRLCSRSPVTLTFSDIEEYHRGPSGLGSLFLRGVVV